MFNHRFDEIPKRTVILHWFMLSFNGGFINAGGFLATGRFVSHVTGFATLFGVDVANREYQAAFGILSVPIFFLLGAFVAGLLIDRPIFQGKKPHFDWVMGLSAFCLFAAAAGTFLHFGDFGLEYDYKKDYGFLVLLCLASGLQNGAITSSSGRSVRTTHLTGLTTDLGLGLSKLLLLHTHQEKFLKELKTNQLRLGSIGSFVFGSAIGAIIFVKLGYYGFILPGLINTYAAWHGKKAKITPHLIS